MMPIDYALELLARTKPHTSFSGYHTGFPGHLTYPLAYGWVAVTYFIFRDSDLTEEWTGPVLEETDERICIEVWGEPMTFSKDRITIRRADQS
jgi:hypothetical protein